MTESKTVIAMAGTILFLGTLALMGNQASAASGSGGEVRLKASMVSGAASGAADYRERGTRRRLNVQAEDLRSTTPSPQTVYVNGVQVGSLPLEACPAPAQNLLCGEMELNTQDGQAVPVVTAGQIVSIGQNPAVLAGTFR